MEFSANEEIRKEKRFLDISNDTDGKGELTFLPLRFSTKNFSNRYL